MRLITTLAAAATLVACAGKIDYVQPAAPAPRAASVKIIDKPRDAVWNASVPELGKQFYVINNMDKSSGLINVSYNGDPERYIDCGRITSFVKNARGERTYDFPGSKAQQNYEVMVPAGLFFIDRKMSLEGRINLVFEEVTATQTKVTANSRYVIQRQQTVQAAANGATQSKTDTITFNSGGAADFPAMADGRTTTCVSTGVLEQEILSAVR